MPDNKLIERSGERIFTSAGALASGAKIYVYDAGTSDLKSIYSNSGLSASLSNPQTADANGLMPFIYVGTGAYKLRVETSAGSLIDEEDNIPGALDTSGFSATFAKPDTDIATKTSDYTVVSADLGTIINGNCTGGTITITLVSAVTATNGRGVTIRHIGSANQVKIVTASSQTVSMPGANTSSGTHTAVALTGRGESMTLVSDGANWHVVAYAPPLFRSDVAIFAVVDRITAAPSSPTAGARYIVETAFSSYSQHDVIEADGQSGFIRYTPAADCGWRAYVQDEDTEYVFRGSAWVPEHRPISVQGGFKNLVITVTGNSAATITADQILLHDNGTNIAGYLARTVSLTLDATSTGANKLDTGTLGNNQDWFLWVIWNGSTVACLASQSSTAPTMPTGYTYKARVGCIKTNGSAQFHRTLQKGRKAQYVVSASVTTAPPTMISGSSGNVSTPTWTAVAVANYVPATASHIHLSLPSNTAASISMVAPNNLYGAHNSLTNPPHMVTAVAATAAGATMPWSQSGWMELESTNVYYASNAGNTALLCLGWEDSL